MDKLQNPFISKDKSLLNLSRIQELLNDTYWGKDRSIEDIRLTIENSRCYGLYIDSQQIGFARVITDGVVFAYLSDVIISKDYQKRGYSKILLDFIFQDADYKNIQRWLLATKDAHEIYRKYGFTDVLSPHVYMEKLSKNRWV